MTVYVDVRYLIHYSGPQLLAKLQDSLVFGDHIRLCDLTRFAEAYNSSNVQSAASHAALVPPTVNHRDQHYSRAFSTHIQAADALWSVDLMRGERSEINVEFVCIEWDLS